MVFAASLSASAQEAAPISPACAPLVASPPDVDQLRRALTDGTSPDTTCPVSRTARRPLTFPEVLMGALIPPLGLMLVLSPGTKVVTDHVPLLTLAVGQRSPHAVDLLIQAGADPLRAPKRSDSALQAAVFADLGTRDSQWTSAVLGQRRIDGTHLCTNTTLLDRLWDEPILRQRLETAGLPKGGLDCDGGTWLHRAAEQGDHTRVARLIDQAVVPIDLPDARGRTAIFRAARSRHWDVVQQLIDAGARIHDVGGDQGSLLHEAVRHNQAHLTDRILDTRPSLDTTDPGGWTVLTVAVVHADPPLVARLLEHGASPRSDPDLLQRAIRKRSPETTRLLLDAGLAPNAPWSFGRDLFDLAYEEEALDVARVLVDAGGHPGQGRPDSLVFHEAPLLARALDDDNAPWVELLLPATRPDERTDTLVHLLIHERYHHAEVVLAACDQPSDALVRVASVDLETQIEWLVDRGVRYGPHALDMLIAYGPEREVARALSHGASPHGSGEEWRRSPMATAVDEKRAALVGILYRAGVQVPHTAWLDAIRRREVEWVSALLTEDIPVPPAALEAAIQQGASDLAATLLPHTELDVRTLRRLRRLAWLAGASPDLRTALRTRQDTERQATRASSSP